MTDLIALLLNMLGRHDEHWQSQVDDLQEKSRRMMKAMVLLGKAAAEEKRQRLRLQKSLQAMQHATKPAAKADPVAQTLLTRARRAALERTALIGKLADQAVRLFGSHGGRAATYDREIWPLTWCSKGAFAGAAAHMEAHRAAARWRPGRR